MRKLLFGFRSLVALFFGVSLLEACNYSGPDVGFADLKRNPYRIVLMVKDRAGPKLQEREMAQQFDTRNSNIVPVYYPVDPRCVVAHSKPVKAPDDVTGPPFWLIALDNRAPALPFWWQKNWPEVIFLIPQPSLQTRRPNEFPASDAIRDERINTSLDEKLPKPWVPERKPTAGPSIFASTRLGIILFVVGITGWIVLVTSAILLEDKAAKR
jgi:hypothetical protein